MTLSLATAPFLIDIGRSLREGFFMFWETLWALVLGFTLSGVVQAFVSKEQMRAKLGDHRPAAVVRASWYGMVSSSCSYAASAMAKSLFSKGADFTAAMVFMIASTNLVVELGVVMLVLLGWQFAAAEFVGGPIMIVLLALSGGFVFTAPVVQRSLERIRSGVHGGHDHQAMSGVSEERQEELEAESFSTKVRSPGAWSDASSYAVADATMLRRELLIGYVIAGFLAVVVPSHAWNDLFLHGHGFWTSFENALVGPLIAVVSWVCSIGNVPLAAALWSGGISFGGVIAFIFADLIAMPLILIYRKLYGGQLTIRLVALFYAVMTIAGLATQEIFRAFGAIPSRRAFSISAAHFEWNYTTFLNFFFILLAVAVWWLAKNRDRFGGGVGYAIDPVCGMQVRINDAPAHSQHGDVNYYFCSDHCREKFESNPLSYTAKKRATGTSMDHGSMDHGSMDHGSMDHGSMDHGSTSKATNIDPVCGMEVDPLNAADHREYMSRDIYFCSVACAAKFDQDPARYFGATDAQVDSPTSPVVVALSKKKTELPPL